MNTKASDRAAAAEILNMGLGFIDLWDAINEYAQACGGDTASLRNVSVREERVVQIDRIIRPLFRIKEEVPKPRTDPTLTKLSWVDGCAGAEATAKIYLTPTGPQSVWIALGRSGENVWVFPVKSRQDALTVFANDAVTLAEAKQIAEADFAKAVGDMQSFLQLLSTVVR